MEKSDFSKARVNDRVWSPFGPECVVGGTNGDVVYRHEDTLNILFDNGRGECFWDTGLQNVKHSAPSLFWSRPHIDVPPPPKRMKKVKVEVQPYGKNGVVAGILVDPTQPPVLNTIIGPLQTIEVEVYDD